MIHKRETKEDLIKQKRLFEVFSKHLNINYNQIHSSSKKYRIDGYGYDNKNNIVCWIECKWYNKEAHCFLNVPKFNELVNLSNLSSIPSYLLFREYNRWGYITIHDGKKISCDYKIKLLGGTPKGRIPNNDDVEPLIILDKSFIVWGN